MRETRKTEAHTKNEKVDVAKPLKMGRKAERHRERDK